MSSFKYYIRIAISRARPVLLRVVNLCKVYPRSLALAFVGIFVCVMILFSAPGNFPEWASISVAPGAPLRNVARELDTLHVVRSERLFYVYMVFFGIDDDLKAGTYYFKKPIGLAALARRLISSDYGATPVKLIVPEGMNVFELAKVVVAQFPNIEYADFIARASLYEGYLFPDTYFFPDDASSNDIIYGMKSTFEDKARSVSGWDDLNIEDRRKAVILASIVEEEASSEEDRRLVAGVLKNRLAINMPLQVDVVFKYINGKTTKTLTTDDLATDSPYNTYKFAGLPPTAISNPSLMSLDAAINSKSTDYWYFLADSKGVVHYSKTYGEHLYKKGLYIR